MNPFDAFDFDAELARLNDYDDDDECVVCAAHISDPHAAGCSKSPEGAPTGGVLRPEVAAALALLDAAEAVVNREPAGPYTARHLIELIAHQLVGVTLASDNAPGLIIGIPDETGPNGMREFIVEAREV
jgi:hypothetical protein